MGFFSFKTSDTNEPIWNRYSEAGECRPVYLLQPGDEDNICEPAYEGYGVFGGMDAYVWIAMHNLPKDELKAIMKGNECVIPDDEAEETLRSRGIAMELSDYYIDKDDGSKWAMGGAMSERAKEAGLKSFEGTCGMYDEPQPKYGGKTPNELIAEGQWVRHPMGEVMLPEGHEYKPLKFSFDKNAKYEDLPAAKNHQGQGFWSDEEQQEIIKELCEEKT